MDDPYQQYSGTYGYGYPGMTPNYPPVPPPPPSGPPPDMMYDGYSPEEYERWKNSDSNAQKPAEKSTEEMDEQAKKRLNDVLERLYDMSKLPAEQWNHSEKGRLLEEYKSITGNDAPGFWPKS